MFMDIFYNLNMFKKHKKSNVTRNQSKNLMDNIVKASTLLTTDMNFKHLVSVVVEQSLDITRSSMCAFFIYNNENDKNEPLTLIYKRGYWESKKEFSRSQPLIEFIEESRESVIVLKRSKSNPFPDIFLNNEMKSGIALPIYTQTAHIGILILNSKNKNYYNRSRFQFLDSFSKMSSGLLHNALLYSQMKESYKKIQHMERYQEGIFSSMTNLLITIDSIGNFQYANTQARNRFNLGDNYIGIHYKDFFKKSLSKTIINSINKTNTRGDELLGLEGIYKGELDNDMDFKLNISPLVGVRGKKLGSILIFTDESKEQELKKQMTVITEERRQIKDMFGRYLSKDLVNSLINKPDLVKPGGDQKQATVLFADIRGYTSFSEGKDPAYIIEILNEYFNEAVEKVISSKGYIDKFIGDCIMAAWGVPMMSEDEDAINAVTCALEIQKLIDSKERHFFKGRAENLKVGIGMHTGYLVAGNLGSSRRMDYTIIGDTVNVAARLEGVAEAGEVIITQSTKERLRGKFILEERTPVLVKGKTKPIAIYNVIDRI